MKSSFEFPDNHIILTGADGNPRKVPRRAVRRFEVQAGVSNDNGGCHSIVYIQPADKEPTYKWNVRESCAEILYHMDGGPSRAQVRAWEEEIIREETTKKIENRTALHHERLQEIERRAAEEEIRYGERIIEPKLALQKSLSALDNSPRLQRAAKIMEWMERQKEGSLLEKAGRVACFLQAGRDAAMLAAIPGARKTLDRMEHQNQLRREHAEEARRMEEAQFKNEKKWLENQRGDLQMGFSEFQILEQKIRDFRLGNQVPDFKYQRDPLAPLERYLPAHELSHGPESPAQRLNRLNEAVNHRLLDKNKGDFYDRHVRTNLDMREPAPEIDREQIAERSRMRHRSRGMEMGR